MTKTKINRFSLHDTHLNSPPRTSKVDYRAQDEPSQRPRG
jgi:hypothetical protein